MRLGLLDLLAPQFLVGFRLPDEVHRIISFLRVETLESTWDETGVVHTGKVKFTGEGPASPVLVQRRPTGQSFEWQNINDIGFRLTLPRAGSPTLRDVINAAAAGVPATSPVQDFKKAVDSLGTVPATRQSSEYPGFGFRLELLVKVLEFPLPGFVPAKVAAVGGLEEDPSFPGVKLVLPKLAVLVTQGDTILDVNVDLDSWGINSLDDDTDLAAGEFLVSEHMLLRLID